MPSILINSHEYSRNFYFITLILWLFTGITIILLYFIYTPVNYKIKAKKDWLPIIIMLLTYVAYLAISYSIRYFRKHTEIPLWEYYYGFTDLLGSMLMSEIILLLILFFTIIIVIFLVFFTIMQNVKRAAKSLFVYLYQYKKTRDFCEIYSAVSYKFFSFFSDWLLSYKKDVRTYSIAIKIWPRPFIFLEKLFIYSFIPYLVYYDYLIYNGVIMTMYSVIFWFSLYMLFRHLCKSLNTLLRDGSTLLTYDLYKYKD